MPDAPADTANRQALTGAWAYESNDGNGPSIAGTVRLTRNALFSGTERHDGAPDENYSGEWFVTAGLLKLKTTRRDGQRLGTSQTGYFTCTLHEVAPQQFSCNHEVGGRTYRFRRLPA